MTRYLVGLIVGSVGTLLGVYLAAALLPATREEKPRDPLPQRTVGGRVSQPVNSLWGSYPNDGRAHWLTAGVHDEVRCGCGWSVPDDTWTTGPLT